MATLALTFGACVSLEPEGRDVELREAGAVPPSCQKIGVVNAKTVRGIGFIPRPIERIEQDLVVLAKNEAGALGGDAIAPASEVDRGRQKFDVFRCSVE